MEWTGEGVLLASRPHGESAAIVDVLTPEQGLHRGVVRGGAGRRMAPILQQGAQLHLTWRARLDDHIGAFTVEPIKQRAALVMSDPGRLAALNSACALTVFALAERDPHPRLYASLVALLDTLAQGGDWFGRYLAFERLLLEETGFGLDLSECAVTGAQTGLVYVSPKTGRAVTREGAGAWAGRLLPLPKLLLDPEADADTAQMAEGLATTGFFLNEVLAPELGKKPVPQARARLVARFQR